jgi:hypothetical protein
MLLIFSKNLSDDKSISISSKGDIFFKFKENQNITKRRRIDSFNFNFDLTEIDVNNLFQTKKEIFDSIDLLSQELDSLITSKIKELNVN